MSLRRLLMLSIMMLPSGCLYHVQEHVDGSLSELISLPYDQQPSSSGGNPQPAAKPDKQGQTAPLPRLDVQTSAWMEPDTTGEQQPSTKRRDLPEIPNEIPGSNIKPIRELPKDPEAKRAAIRALYPELPPLPAEPKALPGPDGKPYTLADLQQLAAANSPDLRQAAFDVTTARGNLMQAGAYRNPITGWNVQPSNDGSTAGVQGLFIDQTILFPGKLRRATAAAEMDLRNAELALRRARSDLATRVRNAYYGVLVAKETMRINKSLASFTDAIYRLHTNLLDSGITVAPYEPMALRALAHTARLAYKNAIQSYIYSWIQLVAAVNMRQLPLSEVAGRIDAFIPYYNFNAVLAYALTNHTDVLTARNTIDKANYNLQSAQLVPYPDVDVNVSVLKEFALPPKQFVHTVTIGFPFPLWDKNRGNIIAAEGTLGRATDEPHRVRQNLTNTLAAAYVNYKNNLDALEYYRRFILPDQVRAYRGVLERRDIEPTNVAFGDLLGAQQTLATDVTTYLTILGQLWTSVVSVADLLQTDDLFQMAGPRDVPPLPDLDHLAPLPCCHPSPAFGKEGQGQCSNCTPWHFHDSSGSSSPDVQVLPFPRRVETPGQSGNGRDAARKEEN